MKFGKAYDNILTWKKILALSLRIGPLVQKEVLMTNKYELALVLVTSLGEEEKQAQLEKIKELIVRFGGEITKVDDWGKKKLAYEIDKKKEGFYYFIEFNAEPDAPAEIESRLRITEAVLRYLIVSLEEK